MTVQYKLGRLPNDSSRPRLTLTLDANTYSPPASVDNYSGVNSWGMLANDSLGDCTAADQGHKEYARNVKVGNSVVAPADGEAIALYEATTGYSPNKPGSDQGAMIQDVEHYGFTNGYQFGGRLHKLALYFQVDYTNISLVKWCVDQFGAVSLGINFPKSAMLQFNEGIPWDFDPTADNTIEGGHDIVCLGYDANYVYVITWGAVQKMTYAFFNKYVEEAWSDVSVDFVNNLSGQSPLLETLYQMGQQYTAISGKANPIPAPTPPAPVPTPTPTPVPTPIPTPPAPIVPVAVDAVDVEFYLGIKTWAEGHKTFPPNAVAAARVQKWIAGKGLAV